MNEDATWYACAYHDDHTLFKHNNVQALLYTSSLVKRACIDVYATCFHDDNMLVRITTGMGNIEDGDLCMLTPQTPSHNLYIVA